MVFESLVVDLLNRFLGDFVDNLDASQLNLGIWGGDVKLNNLEVKESALDEMELPVKLKFGYLSSLVLKIPWKNLYAEPVIAEIEGLHLIVVPSKGIVYNKQKQKKNEEEKKQKKLARLEEARKEKRKPAGEGAAADSFSEKMIAQIIKNLQVKIRSIHVRYEDKYTNRHRPFAAGITLEGLDFMTTDQNWKATIHKDVVKIIHKLVSLNNLSVYWNSGCKMISDLTNRDEMKREMHNSITTKEHRLKDYKFILEPINMEVKLAMNQKPEGDGSKWTIPKIELNAGMDQLALAIAKLQYQDILLFLEGQERFNLSARYVKYRPNLLEYRGHFKEWWQFAYNSILNENIRRKKKNWSWERMKKHRTLFKSYRLAWIAKQTETSPHAETLKVIEEAESRLDVFNLNIARQQAEMEIDRRKLVRIEDQPKGMVAWASSWWGGSTPSKKDDGKDIGKQFERVMTPDEKAKLFEAIDYQENTPSTNYPKFFIENVITFNLNTLKVMVENALDLQFQKLRVELQQRPSANAMHLKTSIKSLSMTGGGKPMMSMVDESKNWLTLEVETNPLEGDYDQLVVLAIAPIMLKYHAPAINTAIDLFKPPDSVRLNQLTAAAMASYEDVKSRSATALAHSVDQKTKLQLDITIHPATIVISESGVFDENKACLVADLGLLTIKTTNQTHGAYDQVPDARLRSLMEKAYDKFHMKLSNVQLILGTDFNKCMDVRTGGMSDLHILEPTGLDIKIHKSSIDDLKLAKIKIFGDLPDFKVRISDERLLMLLGLVFSIPMPPPDPEIEDTLELPPNVTPKLRDRAKMKAILDANEVDEVTKKEETTSKVIEEQQVQVDLYLKLNEVGFVILQKDKEILSASISRFTCGLKMRTFDMTVQLQLGDVVVKQPQFRSLDAKREYLYLIDNLLNEDEYLITMHFVQANPESPFFATDYNSTMQAINFEFKSLNVSLNQQAIMSLKTFGEQLQQKIEKVQKKMPEAVGEKKSLEPVQSGLRSRKTSTSSFHEFKKAADDVSSLTKNKKPRKKRELEQDMSQVIHMALKANINSLALQMGTEKLGLITDMAIKSIRSTVQMKEKTTLVHAGLKEIVLRDFHPTAVHKNLLLVIGKEEMFQMDFVQYNRTQSEKQKMAIEDVDMSVKIKIAQMRFIFLNLWVNRMLNWGEPFQAETQAAAAAAQAAATERATQAAENVRQLMQVSPPKIQLNIELAAPTIIVPKISTSNQSLFIDFGKLTITNVFTTSPKEPKAIIDNMTIMLTDTSVFGGTLLVTDDFVECKCEILKPVTFKLEIKRNLCFNWYKELPEIFVDATLPEIGVAMSQGDYTNIMHTLSGNLGEVVPFEEMVKRDVEDCVDLEKKNATIQLNRKSTTAATPGAKGVDKKMESIPEEEPKTNAKPARRIVFSFKLDQIKACLYKGNSLSEKAQSNPTNSACTVSRDASKAFASMKIKGIKVSGHIMEDNGMSAGVTVLTFTMNDEREGITKIKKLVDKKTDDKSLSNNHPFANVQYAKDAKNNMDVALFTSSFFVCLCPEFLALLSTFFVVEPYDAAVDKQNPNNGINLMQTKTPSDFTTTPKPEAVLAAKQTTGIMTIKCELREIEIILIENSLLPETSQALILSFNVLMDANHDQETQYFKGGVKNLQIFSTYFAQEKRDLCHYPVLKPANINVKGCIGDVEKAQNFDIDVDDLVLKISPSIIRLLSAVSAQFTKNQESIKTENKKVAGLTAYPNFWEAKRFDRSLFHWFVAPAEECADYFKDELTKVVGPIERAQFRLPRMTVTMESGNESTTQPLILLEVGICSKAENWSSLMSVDAKLNLEMSYYNESLSIWEPIIEPVLHKGKFEPWSLECTIRSYNQNPLIDDDQSFSKLPKQKMNVFSKKYLNITLTKSCILLMYKLGDAFDKAAKQISPPSSRQLPGESPYLILNESALVVKISNSESMKVCENNTEIDATIGDYIELDVVGWQEKLGLQLEDDQRNADLCIKVLDTEREISVLRAESRVIPLGRTSEYGRTWKMLVDTIAENNRKVVCLRSLVKFVNHINIPYEVYSQGNDGSLDLCGIADKNKEPMIVPISRLYTRTGEFLLKPIGDEYEMSDETISWYNFEKDNRAWIKCQHTSEKKKAMFAELVVIPVPVLPERGDQRTEISYIVHIFPILTFINLLPFDITITDHQRTVLKGGESRCMNLYHGTSFVIQFDYNGDSYDAEYTFEPSKELIKVLYFTGQKDPKGSEIYLGLHFGKEHHKQEISIFSPFWIINKTGKDLKYLDMSRKANNSVCCFKRRDKKLRRTSSIDLQNELTITHPKDHNPVLFAYSTPDPQLKSKARLAVEGSDYSEEFPLETAGTASRITCGDESGRKFDVTIEIALCHNGLTKVVTFSPFFLLYNDSLVDMEIREQGEDTWIRVPAESCEGLWPSQVSKRKTLNARYAGSVEESIAFPCTETFESFCLINNDYLGMYVNCSVVESSSVIHLEPYSPGMAPAVIMNATPLPISFKQKGSGDCFVVNTNQMKPFTWNDVIATDRSFEWSSGEYSALTNMSKNEYNSYLPSRDYDHFYCVSFLNGRQRLILFTDDLQVADNASQKNENAQMDLEMEFTLHGLGISLVNNILGQEIIYMSMNKSKIIWEREYKSRFKCFPQGNIDKIEEAYQKWLASDNRPAGYQEIDGEFFNFTVMLCKIKQKEYKIMRHFKPGFYFNLQQNKTRKNVQLQIFSLQIDNHLEACIFPIVLAVVPPPKAVIKNSEPKAFIKLAVYQTQPEHSPVIQYQYCSLLLQEFAIQADMGLLAAMMDFVAAQSVSKPYTPELYQKDMDLTKIKLSDKAVSTATSIQKSFFEDLHFSPLMIHLSFTLNSLNPNVDEEQKQAAHSQLEFLNVLLKSVGASITNIANIQDVVLKLAFFEKKNAFMDFGKLQADIQNHYVSQALKQFYVLVLGLDIIGNPFGLVRDLSSGVEDLFYQPYNGLIHGPEEFAEGLALGVTSVFSHTIGGVTGAAGRITGTLGKGVAALTFDDEYQRKRQEEQNRKPQNFGEGMARGVRGFASGFGEGFAGIVRKPMEGARDGGVGGFAKGVGKGLFGAVIRPVSGTVDLASGTLNAIKTCVSGSQYTEPARPKRFIHGDKIIRPYNHQESTGYKYLKDTENGFYLSTDSYVGHARLSDKAVLLTTDKRILLSKKNSVLGSWSTEWEMLHAEIDYPKSDQKSKLTIAPLNAKKGFLGIGKIKEKEFTFPSTDLLTNFFTKLSKAYSDYLEM